MARIKKELTQVERLKKMPYFEYLQTEHWKNKRNESLEYHHNKCQLCGETKRLQIHHNTYKNLGEEPMYDLIVLCVDCHENYHKVKKENRDQKEEISTIVRFAIRQLQALDPLRDT